MFTHEASILQAAAILAAAERTAAALAGAALGSDPSSGPAKVLAAADRPAVEWLIIVLRRMEKEGLIPPDLAPQPTQPGP